MMDNIHILKPEAGCRIFCFCLSKFHSELYIQFTLYKVVGIYSFTQHIKCLCTRHYSRFWMQQWIRQLCCFMLFLRNTLPSAFPNNFFVVGEKKTTNLNFCFLVFHKPWLSGYCCLNFLFLKIVYNYAEFLF